MAPVVQKVDSAIHRRNHYPVDKYKGNHLRYPEIEIYPADIFLFREGVENNNFDPSIAETKGKNLKTSVICPTCCI